MGTSLRPDLRGPDPDPRDPQPDRQGTEPAVHGLEVEVYVVPTDAPEADGTLAWDETTMVLVTARAGDARGIGWSYTAAAAQSVTDPGRPGRGMGLRTADAERYRRG